MPSIDWKQVFQLDPEVIFLNHGSFGACPKPVFEVYQEWQRKMEYQPVAFLGRAITGLLAEARTALGHYVNAHADDLVFFSNPTTALNAVIRSLKLHPGDEILTTQHEYGALDRTWRFYCKQTGAVYVQHSIDLPFTDAGDWVDQFWSAVTPRTRVIFLSHITSPTALIFPVEQICQRARAAGILTIIDGAHVPGQLPLDLAALGADFYSGALHKWLCAPKGAAFLFANRTHQHWLDPLVVSWGYESQSPSSSQFIDYFEWQGTRDLSAFLSVPAAIEFQSTPEWSTARQACFDLAAEWQTQLSTFSPPEFCLCDTTQTSYRWFGQMFAIPLPNTINIHQLKNDLLTRYNIEAPTIHWNNRNLLRVSVQVYNRPSDLSTLYTALTNLLK